MLSELTMLIPDEFTTLTLLLLMVISEVFLIKIPSAPLFSIAKPLILEPLADSAKVNTGCTPLPINLELVVVTRFKGLLIVKLTPYSTG